MSHVFRFSVWARTFAEMESKARDIANEYFGSPDYTLEIDASANHANDTSILFIEGDCMARFGGAA